MFYDKSDSPQALALRAEIVERTCEYFAVAYGERDFVPHVDAVPVSGRVSDERELVSLVDSSLDFWLTTGRFAERFEREFARWYGVRGCILVNSGSSAKPAGDGVLTGTFGHTSTVSFYPAHHLTMGGGEAANSKAAPSGIAKG